MTDKLSSVPVINQRDIDDANMLRYFWQEKGDFKRYTGYEEWAKRNPDFARGLDQLLFQRDLAEENITSYIQQLHKWYGAE
jgi:hypothetical protein